MDISRHLNKNSLHHAYLIEGMHAEVVPEILKFMKEMKVDTVNNPDFCNMIYDSFNVEDAQNLKIKSSEKGFSVGKKIYVISANNFLLAAQNTLLKMFEEPIEDTHFFIIVPEIDVLLKTLISRFYLIRPKINFENETEEAEKFIFMNTKDRISFIKEILTDEDESEDEDSLINTNTPKLKALKFLNALEAVLRDKYINKKINIPSDVSFFDQIFKVREYLRQPGSSAKSLLESIALVVPIF